MTIVGERNIKVGGTGRGSEQGKACFLNSWFPRGVEMDTVQGQGGELRLRLQARWDHPSMDQEATC